MLVADFWQAFQKGKQLTNAAVWKNRAIAGSLVLGFLTSALAVSKAFGYDIQVDAETLEAVAYGIAGLATFGNAVVHTVTSTKVGVSSGFDGLDPNP